MPDPTEQQRAALEKAARKFGDVDGCDNGPCGVGCLCMAVVCAFIATYLAATGREAEAESVRRAGDG